MSELLDPRYFPAFTLLPPDRTDILEAIMCVVEGAPERLGHHWCFMGEITDDSCAKDRFFRHFVTVKDRKGIKLPVRFHLEDNDILDTSRLKNGNTLFVRYARQHWFLDLSVGLRVEDTSFVYAVPCSLSDILEAHRGITPLVCKKCGYQASQRCANCKKTYYCSRECQTDHWSDHKQTCRILTLIAPVTALDHSQRLVKLVPFR